MPASAVPVTFWRLVVWWHFPLKQSTASVPMLAMAMRWPGFSRRKPPNFNPLISHVATCQTAFQLGVETDFATILADCFWPGPLTLVLNRTTDCPVAMLTTAGQDKNRQCGCQPMNRHKNYWQSVICRSLHQAPNPSGRISPSTAHHVHASLAGKIDLISDGGPCENGLESTIIDCSGAAPVLLRPCGISRKAIETALHSLVWTALYAMPTHYLIATNRWPLDSCAATMPQMRASG